MLQWAKQINEKNECDNRVDVDAMTLTCPTWIYEVRRVI